MQDIVIFIEPNEDAFMKSERIANLYMNRFLIDEDAGNELLGIRELGKSAYKFERWPYISILGSSNLWLPETEREEAKKEINKKGLNKNCAHSDC